MVEGKKKQLHSINFKDSLRNNNVFYFNFHKYLNNFEYTYYLFKHNKSTKF